MPGSVIVGSARTPIGKLSGALAGLTAMDLGGIAVGLRHACEDLRRVVEAIVDQVIEADVVVARQAHGARGAIAATEEPGSQTDQDEGQRQQQWRQLEHGSDDSRSAMTAETARPPAAGRAVR